ncbi:MAG: molybdopterin-guanine dinucleotide biosynthesis protein B [Methanobacterium sp.]|uniref:molybdopterin-guanine dinucleotide biosynthesis protein B n=1 Tax=Methanobacterium sp. TaxID=2164 RepID=UPI003D652F6D|nr:molybdopterin-guanine dinucleotide biosynthesis protein B [Methanobacterium sp.]
MKIISVIGTKNTGKTTLVVKIVKELVNRGFKVGTIKHMHKSFDIEGKDTWEHQKAGAELVVGSADKTFFILNESLELKNILNMIECMKKLDFLVIEGLKTSNYAKISVSSFKDEYTIKNVNALEISDDELKSLVDLIEKRSYGRLPDLNCNDCGYGKCEDFAKAVVKGNEAESTCAMKKVKNIELKIDGNPIPMNKFVQNFVRNTTIGMISSLKGDELKDFEGKKIELMIKNAQS